MSPALDLYAPTFTKPGPQPGDKRLPQTSPLVNYRYALDPDRSCGTCDHFQAPGGCVLVTGMIRPVDVCDLWEGELGQRPSARATLALPAEQVGWGVSQAPEVDDPEQLQPAGSPEDPTQAGVYASQPRKGVIGPVRASLVGAREPAQAYFGHRDPAQAYLVREPAQAYFKEAGTPEGAKKGWDEEAHPRDEEGQFTGAGGRAPGGTKKSKAAFLASRYVQLHNAAAKEYKAAFKAVGANMWHGDAAHPLKKYNEDHIRNTLGGMIGGPAAAGKIYSMARPLTVLDSYPKVTKAQRVQLDKRVGAINEKYSKQWKKALRMSKESVFPVRATFVEASTRAARRLKAAFRRVAKSEREISLGHRRVNKVRVV